MILRSETSGDFNKIALVNYKAFSNWRPENFNVDEHVMVALARQLACFDPDLSIIAEENGQIIGHVMLVPVDSIVQDTALKGVMLGPVAVTPERQSSGIGTQLIAEGHKRAAQKGYAYSLLCGHPSYYPKFGYLQNTFSIAGTKLKFDGKDIGIGKLEEKPVSPEDIEILQRIQIAQCKSSSFSFIKQNDFVDWCAHTPVFRTFTLLKDGEPIAYARFHKNQPSDLRELYVKEGMMVEVLAYITKTYIKEDCELSLHIPADKIRRELGEQTQIQDMRHPSDAFMICPFNKNAPINDYCRGVRSGDIEPGIICYPAWIDMV